MKISLLTSRNWEGAYILKELLQHNLGPESILLQKTWWRDVNSYDYSEDYKFRCEHNSKLGTTSHYYLVEELIENKNVSVYRVENINYKDSIELLTTIKTDVLIVVGARVLKPTTIKSYQGMIINFHTGFLPLYRGPHSEFWAMYNNDYDHIGTTIHLIDDGIDTGMILGRESIGISRIHTPPEAHILNTINGAKLLIRVLYEILAGRCFPSKQDETLANYYSFPKDKEIKELEDRLNKKFDLSFAD